MGERTDLVADIIDDIRRVFQVVNEHSKDVERRTGITGPQLWAIKTIAEGAPIMVSDIAARMHLHAATVVGILDRLESRGLARRVRSQEDRRVVRVELTGQGERLVKKAPEVAQGLLVAGLERLHTKNLKSIAASLDQLVDILGAQGIPPKLILSPEVNKPVRQTRRTAK
ncbi:MAG: MarR family transcriptional regulator [Nitrospirae bacterium GWD2_57_9]|nr:MAG: MarR family transcriptional regulator [Nitrospirae bacterium GWD2_57_9]OGW47136.1 MAG: MarR family transcriptional regulator [Nitrospirae bacterium GWC2_57_9]